MTKGFGSFFLSPPEKKKMSKSDLLDFFEKKIRNLNINSKNHLIFLHKHTQFEDLPPERALSWRDGFIVSDALTSWYDHLPDVLLIDGLSILYSPRTDYSMGHSPLGQASLTIDSPDLLTPSELSVGLKRILKAQFDMHSSLSTIILSFDKKFGVAPTKRWERLSRGKEPPLVSLSEFGILDDYFKILANRKSRTSLVRLACRLLIDSLSDPLVDREHSIVFDFDNGARSFVTWLKTSGKIPYQRVPVPELSARLSLLGEADDAISLFVFLFGKQSERRVIEIMSRDTDASMRAIVNSHSVKKSWSLFVRQFGGLVKHRLWNASLIQELSGLSATDTLFIIIAAGGDYSKRVATPAKTIDLETPFEIDYWTRKIIIDFKKLISFVLTAWGYKGEAPTTWDEAKKIANDMGKRELEKLKAKLNSLTIKLPFIWIKQDAIAFLESDYEGGRVPLAFLVFAKMGEREALTAFNIWSTGELENVQEDVFRETIRKKLIDAYALETRRGDFKKNILEPLDRLKDTRFELNKDNVMRYMKRHLEAYQEYLWGRDWRILRDIANETEKRAIRGTTIRGIHAKKVKAVKKQISLAFFGLKAPGNGEAYLASQSARLIWTAVNMLRSHENEFVRDSNRMLRLDSKSLGWGYGNRGYSYDTMELPTVFKKYETDEITRGAVGEEERGPSPGFEDPFTLRVGGLPSPSKEDSSLQEDARPPYTKLPSVLLESDNTYLKKKSIWTFSSKAIVLNRGDDIQVSCLYNQAELSTAKVQKLSPLLLSQFADDAIFHDELALASLWGKPSDLKLEATSKIVAEKNIKSRFGEIGSGKYSSLERLFFSILRLGNSLIVNSRWEGGQRNAHLLAVNLLLGTGDDLDKAVNDVQKITNLRPSFFEKWKELISTYPPGRGLDPYVDAVESFSIRIERLDTFSNWTTIQFAFDPIPALKISEDLSVLSFRLGRADEVHPYGQGIDPDGNLVSSPTMIKKFNQELKVDPVGLIISMDQVDGLWYVSIGWDEDTTSECEASFWWLLHQHEYDVEWFPSDWWGRFENFVAHEDPDLDPKKSILLFVEWLTGRVKVFEGAKDLNYFPVDSHFSVSVYQSLIDNNELSDPLTEEHNKKLISWLLDTKSLEWDLRKEGKSTEAPGYIEQRTGKNVAIIPRKDDDLITFFSGMEIEETTRRWSRDKEKYRVIDSSEEREFAKTSDFFFSMDGVSFSMGLVTERFLTEEQWNETKETQRVILLVKSKELSDKDVRRLAEFLLDGEPKEDFLKKQLPEILKRDPGAFSSLERKGLDSYLDTYVIPLGGASEGPLGNKYTDIFIRWRNAMKENPKRFKVLVKQRIGFPPGPDGILAMDDNAIHHMTGLWDVRVRENVFQLSAAASMERFVEWKIDDLDIYWDPDSPSPKNLYTEWSAFAKETKKNRTTYTWGAIEYLSRKNKISRYEELEELHQETIFPISEWVGTIFPVREEWRQYALDSMNGIHGRVVDELPSVYDNEELRTRIDLELSLSDTMMDLERKFETKKKDFSQNERNQAIMALRDRILSFWNVIPKMNKEERILRWRVDVILNHYGRELYFKGNENNDSNVYSFHSPILFEWINSFFNAFFAGFSMFVLQSEENVPQRSHLMPPSIAASRYRNVVNYIDSSELVGTISEYLTELAPHSNDTDEMNVNGKTMMKRAARVARVDFDVFTVSISQEGGITLMGRKIFRGRDDEDEGLNFSILRVAWKKGDSVGWHYEPILGI